MYELLEEEIQIEEIENEVKSSSSTSTLEKTSKSVSSKHLTISRTRVSSLTSSSSQSSVPSLKRLKQSTLNVFRTCLGKNKGKLLYAMLVFFSIKNFYSHSSYAGSYHFSY